MIGKTLAHYQVLEKLGAGGMGVVYRAIDTRLQRPVAIKVVDRHASADAAGTRLLREVRLASSLNHPNICTVYEVVEPEVTSRSEGFIAMELVEGRLPFEGRSVSELTAAILRDAIPDLGSSVSPQLQSVIRRCLAKDPAQRYQRAGEVRAALDTIQAARPSETRETRFAVRRWLWVVSATIARSPQRSSRSCSGVNLARIRRSGRAYRKPTNT